MSKIDGFTRFTEDIQKYLQIKLPDVPEHIAMEIAAFMGYRCVILVNDQIQSYINHQKLSSRRYSNEKA